MRLATITNWAYGATVALTIVSGTTMLLASSAQESERGVVAQRHDLARATSRLDDEVFALTDHARQYLNTSDPTYLILYRHELAALPSIDARIRHLDAAGVHPEELAILKDAIRLADGLHNEQAAALAAHQRGDERQARQILFGAEYERELDRVEAGIERFQSELDQRIAGEVARTTDVAKLWKGVSETVLAITALLFLCVLYFVFKRRVLHPVVRLSDVVNRLAEQDFAVELPDIQQIDEIGDMAGAIRVFRENGIERLRLEEERAADRAMRDLLSRMTQRMQSCDSLPDLKEVVERFAPAIAPELAGRLYLLDPARNTVVATCSWLDPRYSRAEFPPSACWALRRGLPHRPAGETVDMACDHLCREDAAIPDTLCLPLIAQRETLGLLYFEPRSGAEDGKETPEIYLRMLAENVALALANLRLRDRLRKLAMADALTGLANRRKLDAVLEPQLAEAARQGRPISCLMLDVDHFKQFNDRFGHDAGDVVLRAVGAVLDGATRERGQAFRYGGEEFLLLMAGLDAGQATARAEEIRRRIGALQLPHEGLDLGPVSVSIGVASAPAHCPADRLVATADAALLRAKTLGRDRVVVAGAGEAESAA